MSLSSDYDGVPLIANDHIMTSMLRNVPGEAAAPGSHQPLYKSSLFFFSSSSFSSSFSSSSSSSSSSISADETASKIHPKEHIDFRPAPRPPTPSPRP
ncbi:hypothetical protein B2J93_5871 [Marssonina coronariae]|uniref:Uncharacterized protein n=1 Tax=Diplocarpon coronariae TaxID=2795749 RepID=A0A218Z831_9HELO|nr:hypothetical protein B2J93_5871 [Marssonina coronariae]